MSSSQECVCAGSDLLSPPSWHLHHAPPSPPASGLGKLSILGQGEARDRTGEHQANKTNILLAELKQNHWFRSINKKQCFYVLSLYAKLNNFVRCIFGIVTCQRYGSNELQVDLEIATKEARQSQSELFTLKNATEEALDQLEAAKV